MGWIEDALAAQEMGNSLTVYASAGTGYDGGTTINYGIKVPSNISQVTISTEVSSATGVSADYQLSGDNVTPESGTVSDEDTFVLDIPPGADAIEILFIFNGIDYDPADGPMGSLTFDDVQISDAVLQGDLFQFGSSTGVRVINKAIADEGYFPVYGNSSAWSVKRGIVSKKRKMNLGLD